jgi:hypothetical protein
MPAPDADLGQASQQQSLRRHDALQRLRAVKLISAGSDSAPRAAAGGSPPRREEGHRSAFAATGGLDAHPVERQHFGRRLKEGAPDAWREPNRRLYEHYKARPSSLYGKVPPDALEEMEPRLAAIAHGSLISSPYDRFWRSCRKRLSNGVGRAGVRHRGSGPLPLGIRIATPLGHTLVILWDNCG